MSGVLGIVPYGHFRAEGGTDVDSFHTSIGYGNGQTNAVNGIFDGIDLEGIARGRSAHMNEGRRSFLRAFFPRRGVSAAGKASEKEDGRNKKYQERNS